MTAVVELPALPEAATGADGAEGATPIVISVAPEVIAPLAKVVTPVIVNWVGDIATVGVPEIVPVAVSKVRPSGSAP